MKLLGQPVKTLHCPAFASMILSVEFGKNRISILEPKMTSFRYLALLTFLVVSFCGLPHFDGTAQAQSTTTKEKQEPETARTPQTDQPTTKPADESEQELIARLEKFLTGTKWTGNFIIEGKDELINEHYCLLYTSPSPRDS